MSYDIYFVRRDPGQSFEDALEDTEESFEGDPGPLSDGDLEQWDEVLSLAQSRLGPVEVYGDEATRELVHAETGIQLSLFHGEIAIRVRPGTPLEDGRVAEQVRDLAKAVEEATGLEGFDPQRDEPISERAESGWVSRRATDDWDDDDEGESSGTTTPLPGPRVKRSSGAALGLQRRWWEFWKR